MSKNKTLCIAEWQSFGVDDIAKILCHTEGVARSIQKNSTDLQNPLDSSPVAQNDKERESHNDNNGLPRKASLARNDEILCNKAKKIFNELKAFAEQKGNFDDRKGNHIFLTPYRNNRLQARNYVGLIQTKSGFCLEILPKTFRTTSENQGFEKHQDKINEAKDILLKMLQTLRDSPFKQSHISNLKTHRLPLLEVFAIMFLDELESLIKKGLKSDYITREENRCFLKGKLLFTQNLKHNFAHKERFFTASDEFIADIAPNRLIVSTLLFLSHQNFSVKTSARIMQSRFVFDCVAPSRNYDKDFAKCVNLRHFKAYELLLLWCKIFLKRHNFMPYQGGEKAFALLFDMNELFESFVAFHLKKECGEGFTINSQESSKYLLQGDKFMIKPDLTIYKESKIIAIADTKWKILDSNDKNYGISQGDLYQLFAYLAKYEYENGLLIFPKINDINTQESKEYHNTNTPKEFIYKAISNLPNQNPYKLQILFFDCQKPEYSARNILQVK